MKVYIQLESNQLGDCIAWLPYIEQARLAFGWTIYTNFHYKNLFEDVYPDLNFEVPSSCDKKIVLDITDREKPLQWSAANAFGLEYTEIRPRFNFSKLNKSNGNTVTFSEFGSNYCKSWNNPIGWRKVINYINSINCSPVAVSKEPTMMNNVVDCTGYDLIDVCSLIYNSSLYIGVSSGLAWLAWCLGVPVIMISGHTHPYFEFSSGCIRIGPSNGICVGCYNDNSLNVTWEDIWCPHHKNTSRQHECTYTIEPKRVIDAIKIMFAQKNGIKI